MQLSRVSQGMVWALTSIWSELKRSRLWENQILRIVLIPTIYLWIRSQLNQLVVWLADKLFVQVRFKQDKSLRAYIGHRKYDATSMSVTTQDQGAEDEVLEDDKFRLFSYRLDTPGTTPCYVTHVPENSGETMLWMPSANFPWWRLPVVWMSPDLERWPLWESLPAAIQSFLQKCFQTVIHIFPHAREALTSQEGTASEGSGKMVVSCFRWNRELIPEVVNTAINFARKRNTLSCLINHLHSDRVSTIKAPPRKMSTVILGDTGKALLADIEAFFSRRDWYKQNDLPYQRVYLLHGPPGNGKSSFLQACSILFELPYYYLELTGRQLTQEGLRNILSDHTLSEPCLLALEDAESLFKQEEEVSVDEQNRREAEQEKLMRALQSVQGGDDKKGKKEDAASMQAYGVSAADLVQMLGAGLNPPAGRIIFFTTNHVDRLHLDLLRLVDEQGLRVEFPNASLEIMHGMWSQFYQDHAEVEQTWSAFEGSFLEVFDQQRFSAASMQEYMMRFRKDPLAASQPENVLKMQNGPQTNTVAE